MPPETELTPQQQKGLTISKDIVGLDLTKYKVDSTIYPPDSYLGVVSQENVGYDLTSNTSNLRLMYTFTNGNLTLIHVLGSETEGSPILAKPAASVVEAAKSFLSNYQIYSGNTFYSQLQSMIDLKDAASNATTLSGNIKLKVTNTQESTTFNWIYTNNGVDAADKCVALVYKNGFLNAFIDNWNLYNVGSATVNLSESQAVSVAMDAAQKFSWKVGADNDTFEVKDFNISKVEGTILFFGSSVMADQPRSSDRLMLYPVWRVGLLLDKVYPGDVFAIQVDIWADTQQVRSIQEQVSTMDTNNTALTANSNASDTAGASSQFSVDATTSSSASILWVATLAFGTSMAGTTLLCVSRKKYSPSFGLLRLRSFRFGLPLCILVASTMVLAPMTVNASVIPNNRATVFGAESTGQPYVGYRKTQGEILTQRIIAQNITSYFAANGYNASNYQGSNSLKPTILSVTSYNEQNYLGAAVVDFDHGVMRNDYSLAQGELHYLIEDNVGQDDSMTWVDNHQVYDMDIYNQTMGRTFFAFINTCLSADTTYNGNSSAGNPQGMPYAWTHLQVGSNSTNQPAGNMSGDGYNYPDSNAVAYIGFPYGSAALNQTVPDPDNPDGLPYSYFVDRFFYYALTMDMSVNDALDHASYICFTPNYFGTSPIHTGFTSYWPGGGISDPYGPNSTLVVYGNGNIHLYEHTPVATYYLNEGTGTTVYDSSGNSNTGTVYNGANWTTGHESSALSFDGTSNYVEIPNSNSLNMNNQISIAVWVNLQADHNSSINTMIRKDGNYAIELGDAGNNKPAFLIYFTDGTGYRLDGPEIPKYQWHHCAGTYDGNYMRLYIDGIQVASGSVSKTIASNTNPVRIARINTNLGTEWFKGILDEVYIYNYSLTQQEITRLASWSGPSTQSSYSLTVIANDSYNNPVNAGVWVDGTYRGVAGSTFSVTPGSHRLQVSKPNGTYLLPGFTFDHFSGYGTGINPIPNLQVSSDMTITAYYSGSAPNQPTLNGPSSPTYVNTWLNFNATATDPAGHSLLYYFYWGAYPGTGPYGPYSSGATASLSYEWTSTGSFNVTVYAKDYSTGSVSIRSNPFTVNIQNPPPQYTITASSDANSTINPSGQVSVTQGGNQTFTMSANTGYNITNVYVDSQPQGVMSSYTFNNVQANRTISVTSAINTYTLTPYADSGGSISPNTPQTVNYGSNSTTFNITSNGGYHTVDVVLDSDTHLGAVSSYQFTNVQANHTISASFAQDATNYTLTISAGTGGITTPSPGTYSYTQGSNVQVTASNSSGYTFDRWVLDGLNNSSNPISVTMNSNHNLTAYFTQQQSVAFQDGFESGGFGGWTGTEYDTSQTISVVASNPHHGAYNGLASTDSAWKQAYVYKDVTATNTLNARFYLKIPTLSSGVSGNFAHLDDGDYNSLLRFYIRNNAGTYQFGMRYMDNGSLSSNVWSAQHSPNAGDYVCIELKHTSGASNAAYAVYVNGSELTDISQASKHQSTAVSKFLIGILGDNSAGIAVNFDCVVLSNSYIGSEGSSYTIVASADSNSTISPSGTVNVASGGSQAFTMSANAGYHLSHVYVDSADQGATSTYTFTNVTATHTISVTSAIDTNATPTFGYTTIGTAGNDGVNAISGSVFTCTEQCTVQSITAALRSSSGNAINAKCAIYRHSDLALVATTQELSVAAWYDGWKTFNFTSPPTLTQGDYVLVAWSDTVGSDFLAMYYDTGDTNQSHRQYTSYGSFPNPLSPTHDSKEFSIYATYTP